jgi:hypothetical protein
MNGLDLDVFLLEGNMSREENALSVRFVDVPQQVSMKYVIDTSNSQSLLRKTMDLVSHVRTFDI